MSNYYCPRCGKTIIDNPRGPDNIHSCTPKDVIQSAFEDKLIEGVEQSSKKPISDFINI